MRLFKNKGITRVQILQDQEYFKVYVLNAEGLVVQSEIGRIKRGKRTVHGVCTYRYSASGQLASKLYHDKYNEFLDSLAYDHAGRVIYYRATMFEVKGRRPPKVNMSFFDLLLHSSDASGNVLRDSAEHGITYYSFDAQNQIVRVGGGYRTDSVSVHADTSGNLVRRYWYRKDSTGFHLGQEEISRNGRMLSEVTYEMGWLESWPAYKTNFHYDKAFDLIRKDRGHAYLAKEIFTYEDHLVMEHITVSTLDIHVDRYRYWFE